MDKHRHRHRHRHRHTHTDDMETWAHTCKSRHTHTHRRTVIQTDPGTQRRVNTHRDTETHNHKRTQTETQRDREAGTRVSTETERETPKPTEDGQTRLRCALLLQRGFPRKSESTTRMQQSFVWSEIFQNEKQNTHNEKDKNNTTRRKRKEKKRKDPDPPPWECEVCGCQPVRASEGVCFSPVFPAANKEIGCKDRSDGMGQLEASRTCGCRDPQVLCLVWRPTFKRVPAVRHVVGRLQGIMASSINILKWLRTTPRGGTRLCALSAISLPPFFFAPPPLFSLWGWMREVCNSSGEDCHGTGNPCW